MANTSTSPASSTSAITGGSKHFWVYVLLGVTLMVVGAIALGDTAHTTILSAKFIGACAIFGGSFEAVHAFWTKGWGGFTWRVLLGALYFAIGIILLLNPASNQVILTWLFGLILGASGCVRVYLGFVNFSKLSLPLLLSGIFGIVAGAIVLTGWPISGLWAMGLLIGLDLLLQGAAWVAYAWRPA